MSIKISCDYCSRQIEDDFMCQNCTEGLEAKVKDLEKQVEDLVKENEDLKKEIENGKS